MHFIIPFRHYAIFRLLLFFGADLIIKFAAGVNEPLCWRDLSRMTAFRFHKCENGC